MEKIDRISLKNLDNLFDDVPCYKTIKWHSYDIVLKQLLSFDQFVNVVRAIFKDCKIPDTDNMVQLELIDFAIKTNIISAYANVELPENSEDLYKVIYGTDLYELVCDNVSRVQVKSIIDSVMLCLSGR